jgi:hypothetical protein
VNDKRKPWIFNNCTIIPVNCYHDTWGKQAEPMTFGKTYRTQYWRIEYPNGSWEFSGTKHCVKNRIKWRQDTRPELFYNNSTLRMAPKTAKIL